MKTSSGDVINLDFSNEQSTSFENQKNDNSESTQLAFSSQQAFSFNMQTNGIDEQDQIEIAKFMEIAQPKIDAFMKELEEANPTSPVNKVAREVSDMLNGFKEKEADPQALAKNSVVQLFDEGISKLKQPDPEIPQQTLDFEKLMEESQKLLEKILGNFEKVDNSFYA
jgi:DNA-binding MarR family transcriptional regulator